MDCLKNAIDGLYPYFIQSNLPFFSDKDASFDYMFDASPPDVFKNTLYFAFTELNDNIPGIGWPFDQ
jgi:hypothetical protein